MFISQLHFLLDDSKKLRARVHVLGDSVPSSGCMQMQPHTERTSGHLDTETHEEEVCRYR